MVKQKKEIPLVLALAKEELLKEKREKFLIFFFLFLTLFAGSVLLIFLSTKLILTGYASVAGKAGYIYEIDIYRKVQTVFWAGVYGAARWDPDFAIPNPSHDFESGEIDWYAVDFDCIQPYSMGTSEVYISINDTIDFDNLQPANVSLIDDTTLEVCLTKNSTINEIVKELSKKKIEVISMRNKVNRLEELFLELVNNGN